MAKRRSNSGDEVSLFPFLSILACLIGALIMIIVVLCVAQTQQTDGRKPEEIEMARQYQEMLEQQKQQSEQNKDLTQKIAQLEKLISDLEQKQQRVARLRKLLSSSDDMIKTNQEISQNLLKELDNLLLEIEGFDKQKVELKKEIDELLAEMKKREIPKDKPIPPVIVQPGGSGLAVGSKVFFVEAGRGKITIYWDADKKTVVSATDQVIAADTSYEAFLKHVKSVANAKIIYLLRDDGMGPFNKAAGWAAATYGFSVDQLGRLPIPGSGQIDLKMFKDFLGTMPPPPGARLVAPDPKKTTAANF